MVAIDNLFDSTANTSRKYRNRYSFLVGMPSKCSAFGCRNGYKNHSTDSTISFHSFPLRNPELLAKWVKVNPRKGFTPTKHSKMCSIHFTEDNFIKDSKDSNERRLKSVKQLRNRYLKPEAVPSYFPNAPNYLSSNQLKPRSTTATSEGRIAKEAERLQLLESSLNDSDELFNHSLIDIEEMVKVAIAPSGFFTQITNESLLVYSITLHNNIPQIDRCITILKDLNVTVSFLGDIVQPSQYVDIVPGNLSTLTQLLNLMARLKSLEETPVSVNGVFESAVQHLNKVKSLFECDTDEFRKSVFLIEQLKLLQLGKYHRHYSPDVIILSYLLHSTSHAAYKLLLEQGILCLPSITTLKKITRKVNEQSGLTNTAYLKLRYSKLEQLQRHCLLMIDEVYVSKRVEYSGGKVYGLTDSCEVASTLLCFMIKSVAGGYKDIVSIYPISNLTSKQLLQCYQEVMSLLESVSFNVIAISVDNAAVNRRFLIELCDGVLKSFYTNPKNNQPIYLFFDPVHNLKNIYNNFQGRKIFKCPEYPPLVPNGFTANFFNIVELHDYEASLSLRKAQKLSPKVLNPKSMERTSVKLAAAVFCESTRDAMDFYSKHEGKNWKSTAAFISVILKVWKILNVKSSTKGRNKRDIQQDPVRSSADWKLQFLREFSELLTFWETNSDFGLSKETFLATRQTCLAIADCAAYLIDNLGLSFILLGKLQSDNIESRFGWFRQLSGSNYFVSMRQVLESDTKIRAISLMKFSGLALADIDAALSSQECTSNKDDEIVQCISDQILLDQEPTASDANIIFYVAGAIARSCIRTVKCRSCEDILVMDEISEPLYLDQYLEYSSSTFLDEINRGGLKKCTNIIFLLAVLAWKIFESIRKSACLRDTFLRGNNQRHLFCSLVNRLSPPPLLEIICHHNHDVKFLFISRFFNALSKQFVHVISNEFITSRQSCKKRKLDKLTSK